MLGAHPYHSPLPLPFHTPHHHAGCSLMRAVACTIIVCVRPASPYKQPTVRLLREPFGCSEDLFFSRQMGKNKRSEAPTLPRIRYMSCVNFSRRSRCYSSSRYCYQERVRIDSTWSREIPCGGDSQPEMPSSPGSVGLARAHPLTTQARVPSRQTRSSYDSPQ